MMLQQLGYLCTVAIRCIHAADGDMLLKLLNDANSNIKTNAIAKPCKTKPYNQEKRKKCCKYQKHIFFKPLQLRNAANLEVDQT